MKKSTIIALSIFLLIATFIRAQTPKSGKVTVFTPGTDSSKNEETLPAVTLMNVIKWNHYLLPRGVFMVNYERKITEKLSFEGGFGLTYRDWIFEFTQLSEEVDLFYGPFNKPIVKFAIEAGLRLYPREHDNFEGFYLSPMLSYRTYGFESQEVYGTVYPTTTGGDKPGYSFFDLQAKFGYQFESFFSWDILRDLYIGIGYRNATLKQYEETSTSTSQGTLITGTYTKTQMHYPQVLVGMKFCFPY